MTDNHETAASIERPVHNAWIEIAIYSLMFMELSWAMLWYTVFTGASKSIIFCSVVFGVMIIVSHYLARIMNNMQLKPKLRTGIMLIWVTITALISMKIMIYPDSSLSGFPMIIDAITSIFDQSHTMSGFWHLVFSIICIWRGIFHARTPVGPHASQTYVRIGVLALLPYLIFFAKFQPDETILFSFTFIFFGLISLTTTKTASLPEIRGGKLPSLSIERIIGIIISVIPITGLALAGAFFINSTVAGYLIQAVYLVFLLFSTLILLILFPLVVGFLWLVDTFMSTDGPVREITPFDISNLFKEPVETMPQIEKLLTTVQAVSRPAILGGILIGVLALVLLSLHWQSVRRNKSGMENIEETSKLQPIRLFTSMVFRDRSLRRSTKKIQQIMAAARITQVYEQLMRLCEKMGNPRPAATTPLEFLPDLYDLFPGEEENLDKITYAFLKVRYGEYPESRDETREVQDAWKSIRSKQKQFIKGVQVSKH